MLTNMTLTETYINGLYIAESKEVRLNENDILTENYNQKFLKQYELNAEFVSEIEMKTKKGCVRGIYFYRTLPVYMLARVPKGEIYFAVVDMRKESPTYSKQFGVFLSEKNKKQIYIPSGFAYGFLTIEDISTLAIKSNVYDLSEERIGIAWNDRDLKIDWPMQKAGNIIVSKQDQRWPVFSQIGKYYNY